MKEKMYTCLVNMHAFKWIKKAQHSEIVLNIIGNIFIKTSHASFFDIPYLARGGPKAKAFFPMATAAEVFKIFCRRLGKYLAKESC